MRREPFSHWVAVFQKAPLVDLEVRSYLFTRETPLISKIIKNRIVYAIQRKHIWPNYKLRYLPFFPRSRRSMPIELPTIKNDNLLPGILEVSIDSCDRLSVPFGLFDEKSKSSLSIFFTCNLSKQRCEDDLRINRDDWRKFEFEFIPKQHKISIKDVLYMGRSECLIEKFDPLPDGIEDLTIFKSALEDNNIFLMEIQGQENATFKEINYFLKSFSMSEQRIKIVVAVPLLYSIQVPLTTAGLFLEF